MLFTDEAVFARRDIVESHIWAEDNPNAITENHFQVEFL